MDDDPIVISVSSGYANDPLAFHMTRSGRTIWMYPLARQRYEAQYEREHGHRPLEMRITWVEPPPTRPQPAAPPRRSGAGQEGEPGA